MIETQSRSATTHAHRETMGLPVKTEFMFRNTKGVEKKGIKKRQLRLLKKVSFLSRFLAPDEQILLVTTACSPISVMEQLTTGWMLYYLKRALLVFTNKRIIHIPATVSYDYRHSIAQIGYNDVESIKMGWRTLKVRYRNGKKENFLYIGARERKKIKALMSRLKRAGTPSPYRQRYHLCPSCTASLQVGKWTCPSCRLEFKNSRRARLLSLLIPGGGYFYTGHWFLGLSDLLVELTLLLWIVAPTGDSDVTGGPLWVARGMFAVLLIIEKWMTIYHAEHYVREYIPLDNRYPKRAAA